MWNRNVIIYLQNVSIGKSSALIKDTTLRKFRDEGKIRFLQPQKNMILYDYDLIMPYIE